MTNRTHTPSFLRRALALFFVVFAVLFSAPASPVSAGTDTCRFKILQAAAEAPPVNVFVGSRQVASNLAYTKFSGLWAVPAGSTPEVRVFNATNPSLAPLIITNFRCELGKYYVLAIATIVPVQQPPTFQLVVITLPDRPTNGTTALGLANLAPAVPAADLIRADNSVIVDNVAYATAKFAIVSPGAYDLRIRQTGTSNILVTFPTQNFAANRVYTVYLFDASPTARTIAGVQVQNFIIVRER